MTSKVNAYCKEINDLIEDDEGLALMNLTILKSSPKLYQSPLQPDIMVAHEEVEELLEAYLMDFNSIGNYIYLYLFP
jgi:hypothetical protein